MANNYIHPEDTFLISLNLEVSVDSIGLWKGIHKDHLQKRYDEMIEDGSFAELLKSVILSDINYKEYNRDNVDSFDTISFNVKEVKQCLTHLN